MYTAQHISYSMYSTHYVTWLDNFEMLCNFTRKQANLGMSNLMKQMLYLGIIYRLRNFSKGELDSLQHGSREREEGSRYFRCHEILVTMECLLLWT